MKTKYMNLAQRLADLFAEQAQVEAVALAGSLGGEQIDAASDIDLYVYTRAEIPLSARQQIMEQAGGASRASMGLNFWGPGDEWFDAHSGIEVDIVSKNTVASVAKNGLFAQMNLNESLRQQLHVTSSA